MKRLFVFLLALVLLCPSALADVQGQVNAPARVTDTFRSNTGKTVIEVDAAVSVPDADALYLIPIASTAFDDAMVPRLAELVWPGLGSRKMKIEDENDTESREGQKQKNKYFRHLAYILQKGTKQQDIDVQAGTSYFQYAKYDAPLGASLTASVRYDERYRQKKTVNFYSPYPNEEITADIAGHPLTLSQAADIGNQLMAGLTDQPFALFSVGQVRGRIPDGEQLEGNSALSYTLTYTRMIGGAPLLPSYGAAMNTSSFRDDLYVPAAGYEQVLMVLNREGQITAFNWASPYVIGDERTEQVLLPCADILSVARMTLPLKYQVDEVHGDVRLRVYRIDLGYMAVLQRDTLTFALAPVWNFYGYEAAEDAHADCHPCSPSMPWTARWST